MVAFFGGLIDRRLEALEAWMASSGIGGGTLSAGFNLGSTSRFDLSFPLKCSYRSRDQEATPIEIGPILAPDKERKGMARKWSVVAEGRPAIHAGPVGAVSTTYLTGDESPRRCC